MRVRKFTDLRMERFLKYKEGRANSEDHKHQMVES